MWPFIKPRRDRNGTKLYPGDLIGSSHLWGWLMEEDIYDCKRVPLPDEDYSEWVLIARREQIEEE